MSKTFYLRDRGGTVGSAIIIPAKNEEQPEWVKECGLSYRDDGKSASISDGCGLITGMIGVDTLVFWGKYQGNTPMVDIIYKGTENYRGVTPCNADGTNL